MRRLIPQENYYNDLKSSNEDSEDYDRGNNYIFQSEPRLRDLTELDLKSPDGDADDNRKKDIFLSAPRLRELTEPVVFNNGVATKQGASS